MRLRYMLAVFAGTIVFSVPVNAQVSNDDIGGVRTETQDRMRAGDQTDAALNWLGLIGLLGLWGLKKGHDEDSYHPSDIE